MATNRDLLKEAIADAKAVKDMAIANAKAALEESFTPQLKSMLSAKLQEMEEEEEEMEEALGTINDPDTPTAHGNVAEIEKEDELEEDLDLEALLNELNEEKEDEEESEESEESEEEEEEGEPLDLENMTDEDLKKMIEDVIADMMGSGELELEKSEEEMPGEEVGAEEEEEINLEELLAEIATLTEDEEEYEAELEETKEDLDEDYASIAISTPEVIGGVLAALGIVGAAAAGTIKDIMKAKSKKEVADIVAKAKESSTELEEAYSTIESLRKDLNEVNLLNAKLLYTNKIFKAKNLTESQKVNVLGMFDKATNVGEVKLVFETLSEGLKAKPTAIKENLGSASKTIGTTNTKQPIVESDPMVARFQKLAGIIKD